MNQNLTEIIVILDRSGSMSKVRNDVIGGFNTFLEKQKGGPGFAKLTLVIFDDVIETVYNAQDINTIPSLEHSSYVPRNGTALLEAMGKTIDSAGERFSNMPEHERPGKVIVLTMTDGEENSSERYVENHNKKYRLDQLFARISHQRDVYKWEFMFIGANQDAIQAGNSLGISANSSITYAQTSHGTKMAYMSASNSVLRARSGGTSSFTDDDRKIQQEELKKH